MEESNKVVKSRQPKKSQQEPAAPTSAHQNQQGRHQLDVSGKTSSKESLERITASIPPPREDYVMAESDVMPDISPGQSTASGANASDVSGVVVPGHIEQEQTQDVDKKVSKGYKKHLKVLKKKTIKAERKVDKLKRKIDKAKRKDARQSKQVRLHEKLTKAFSKLERRKKKLDEVDK